MPWTRTSPLTGTCRAGLKVGGGGKGQEELGLACHVMARRRPGSLFTLKKKKKANILFHCSAETYGAAPWKLCTQVGEYTRMQACTQIQEDSHVKHHETASHLYSSPFLHRPPLQKHSTFNTISGGHTRSVLNAHPQPLTIQYAKVLND